jgi:hypothetical protein
MGRYDDIHTGTRCGQTKAFGKGLGDFSIGDSVKIHQDPLPIENYDYPTYTDGQVAVQGVGGGWLIVRDGVWVDWVDDPVEDLPCFDDAGRPVAHGLRWQDWVEANLQPEPDCVYCEAIRALEAL